MIDVDRVVSLHKWAELNSEPQNPWQFLEEMETLNYELVVLVSTIFWPRLREHDGAILLIDNSDDADFQTWFEALDGDLTAVERQLNHVHLGDFLFDAEPAQTGLMYDLANTVATMWRHRLNDGYPNVSFVVEVTQEDSPVLTFHRDRL